MIVYSAKRISLTRLIFGVAFISTLLSFGCVNNSHTAFNSSGELATVAGNWQLFEIPGYATNKYRRIYRHFTLNVDNNGINGIAANNYSAGALWGKGTVRLTTQLATTRKMAMGDTAQLEKIYLSRLTNMGQWKLNGRQLTLSSSKGDLIFQRVSD